MRSYVRRAKTSKFEKPTISKHRTNWYDGSFGCMALFFVCILEFIVIMHLWRVRMERVNDPIVVGTEAQEVKRTETGVVESRVPVLTSPQPLTLVTPKMMDKMPSSEVPWEGVAACLLLGQPEWFQRRYTQMVRNVRDNIPTSWGIQIFYSDDGQTKHGFEINKGLQRMIEKGLVTLTQIPHEISAIKRRPKEMWTDRWLWSSMKASRILVFGGNGVLCGNSPHTVNSFAEWDYVGSPWDMFKKVGGDGGISLRNRDAMIAVIDYEVEKTPQQERAIAYRTWGLDDQFFVSRMLEMNKRNMAAFRLGSREATLSFGAIGSWGNTSVFAVSGTLSALANPDREKFLAICPELKTIFPALHDPHCFGASSVLDPEICAASICALQDRKLHKGGC